MAEIIGENLISRILDARNTGQCSDEAARILLADFRRALIREASGDPAEEDFEAADKLLELDSSLSAR